MAHPGRFSSLRAPLGAGRPFSSKAAIWARSVRICPFSGKTATGATFNSPIPRRSTLSAISRSRAAYATTTPRSVTNLTVSSLNSRLDFHLVIYTLQFMGHDPIFVSTKPSAAQQGKYQRTANHAQPWATILSSAPVKAGQVHWTAKVARRCLVRRKDRNCKFKNAKLT